MRILALLALLGLAGCAAGPDGAPPAPADTATTTDTTSAPVIRTSADARRVLRAVYRPIRTFYQRMETPERSGPRPPAGMRTPDALADTLTQTMAPQLARSFTDQLLMKRDDGYIVRPTEKILLPHEGSGPALEAVSITREGDAYLLTERYAKTLMKSRVERTNVVRRKDGAWHLADIR